MSGNIDAAEAGEKIEFEGMKLAQAEIDRIKLIRQQGQEIKDGIDLEHVHSYPQLVNVFTIALGRAKREQGLDKAIK